jgi:hypothetical protein
MISKKTFEADGTTNRFLSDFIIKGEQFARPYVFIYDNTLATDGTEDVLQDGTTDQSNWNYPDNLWKRGGLVATAKSADLVSSDKWDVVDNSILYYVAPPSGSTVWVEVATTSEEFGTSLIAPSVYKAEAAADLALSSSIAAGISETNASTSATTATSQASIATTKASEALSSANASEASRQVSDANVLLTNADVITTNNNVALTNADVITTTNQASVSTAQATIATTKATEADTSATNAQLSQWEAEAEKLTADSYATEPEDVFVKIYTSNGNGTFTATPTTEYSALHYSLKAETFNPNNYLPLTGGTLSSNLAVSGYVQATEFRGDGSQLTNVAKDVTSTIFSGSSNTVYPLAAWQGGEFMSLDKYVCILIRWSILPTSSNIYTSMIWINPVQQGFYTVQSDYKYMSSKWWVPFYNGDSYYFGISTYTVSGFSYAAEGYIREIIVIGEDVAS